MLILLKKTCTSVGEKTLIQQEFWLSQQNFTMHVETLFKVWALHRSIRSAFKRVSYTLMQNPCT